MSFYKLLKIEISILSRIIRKISISILIFHFDITRIYNFEIPLKNLFKSFP